MDDAGFLAAIRAAPDDPAPRLIYADWLDECGDSRAELIRTEERMRELPVFGDDYWHLKPRRDQLKATALPNWLSALGYNLPQPIFAHGWPDDWKGRWRVIRAYVDEYVGVPMADVGTWPEAVFTFESEFGREMPPSLRELSALSDLLNATLPWDRLVGRFEGRMTFASLNGGAGLGLCLKDGRYRGVGASDFGELDPPTREYHRWPAGRYESSPWPAPCSVADLAVSLILAADCPERLSLVETSDFWARGVHISRPDWLQAGMVWVRETPGGLATFETTEGIDPVAFRCLNCTPPDRIPAWVWEWSRHPEAQTSGVFVRIAGVPPSDQPSDFPNKVTP